MSDEPQAHQRRSRWAVFLIIGAVIGGGLAVFVYARADLAVIANEYAAYERGFADGEAAAERPAPSILTFLSGGIFGVLVAGILAAMIVLKDKEPS